MMSWLSAPGSGRPLPHGQRVAGTGKGDVGHGGPHGALVGVGAAEPAAEQKELGEELLAHGGALGLKCVRRARFGRHVPIVWGTASIRRCKQQDPFYGD